MTLWIDYQTPACHDYIMFKETGVLNILELLSFLLNLSTFELSGFQT
jgi:hypothetical protein